jgi:AraC-like DNA-binding protein
MEIMIQAALYTGPLVIIVLFSHALRKNANNAFLALSLLCIWYGLLMTRLNITREIFEYPALIRTGNIGGYLIYSFLYIYVRNTFYPGRLWRYSDLLMFIPALIYVVDMLPFFFSPADEKIAIFRESLSDLKKLQRVSEGWIHIRGLHFIMRYLFAFLILVLIIIMIVRNRSNQAWQSSTQVNKPFYFMVLLTVLYSPSMFPGIFGAIFHSPWFTLQFLEASLTISLIGVIIYLIYSPDVLYGYLKSVKLLQPSAILHMGKLDPIGGEQLEAAGKLKEESKQVEMVLSKMERYLEEHKPYLQPGFSIRDLSKELSVPVYQISYIINNKYDRHFSNWLNYHRIEYFLELASSGQYKNITLEALAKEAGFSNRITFINAFKREKGMSPGAFLKLQKIEVLSTHTSM